MSNSICLAMIVKNEGRIIKRCLDSAKPFIDGYFIIDTGSTDDTMEIIREELKDLPGHLTQEKWVNFGTNRSSLVSQARVQGYDYLLLADADMVFEGSPDSLDNLTEPSYLIKMAGGFEWHMPYLVRSDLHWEYVGVTHEFLSAPESFVSAKLDSDFVIHHKSDGGNRGNKFTQDYDLLSEEYSRDPNNDRTVFYYAQTCKDLGKTQEAIELYRRRAKLGGWDQEVYWSLYQVALLTGEREDYLNAFNYRPTRPEAVYGLLRQANAREEYEFAYMLGQYAVENYKATEDILFVERWMETWGINFELGLTTFYRGQKEISKFLFESVLEAPDLTDEYRQLTENNLTFF